MDICCGNRKIALLSITAVVVTFIPSLLLVMYLQEKSPKRILKGFPVNDPDVVYSIHCNSNTYVLIPSKKNSSAVGGVFIGSSPVNLEEFCEQEVVVQFEIRPKMAQPLCRQGKECTNPFKVKSPVIDIYEITRVLH